MFAKKKGKPPGRGGSASTKNKKGVNNGRFLAEGRKRRFGGHLWPTVMRGMSVVF